jgi:hypothetical protein
MMVTCKRMPDLDSPISELHTSTWRDKKNLCYSEGYQYAESGESIGSNPYLKGSWSWQWFNEGFYEYFKNDSSRPAQPHTDQDRPYP